MADIARHLYRPLHIALCGWLAERGWDRSWWRTAIAMSLGHVLILLLGFLWLSTIVGAAKAYAVGVAPFYAATVAKTALAVLALPLAWNLLNKPGKSPSKG